MTAATLNTQQPPRPWYRETWPWLLMAGPAIVVVAGFITLYYAIVSFDGMVADDYYKRGLTVNQDLTRQERARTLAIRASLTHDAPARKVSVALAGNAELPATLTLRFVHPTRAGSDQRITLNRVAPGQYESALLLPPLSKWNVQLDGADWSLVGEWTDTAAKPLSLGTPVAGAKQ